MMYGLWGESHTNELPKPFRRDLPAEKSCVRLTQLQLMTSLDTHVSSSVNTTRALTRKNLEIPRI
jgi:hypothetical protein